MRLYGKCASCGYWYIETLWIGEDVPPELNQPKDYPCECGGVIMEVVK